MHELFIRRQKGFFLNLLLVLGFPLSLYLLCIKTVFQLSRVDEIDGNYVYEVERRSETKKDINQSHQNEMNLFFDLVDKMESLFSGKTKEQRICEA